MDLLLVKNEIVYKYGEATYLEVEDAYRCGDKNKELIILAYLKLLFKYGNKVKYMHTEGAVLDFSRMLKRVYHETHRMTGFLRFREMQNGVFYGWFSSDNDIIDLLIPHFSNRFNTQKFVIHDVVRGKMVIYDVETVHKMLAPQEVTVELSADELSFSRMWRGYLQDIAIDGRLNPKLQTALAPKKYRAFMTEFEV
jgi:probable DNA metabolism protein